MRPTHVRPTPMRPTHVTRSDNTHCDLLADLDRITITHNYTNHVHSLQSIQLDATDELANDCTHPMLMSLQLIFW